MDLSPHKRPHCLETRPDVSRAFIQIFQDDLVDYPGTRRGLRMATSTGLQWQVTIQQGLV
ncbi:hypothetical protein PAXRUDRAFT_349510 [Paxillus rubicundulus Ve08.2h10]|uniref:Uncharacterized protein n=1 Tax=Paxillus rubicundulus Ve08.2h10 TaxID=930991 RepID=A0A0D0DBK5_9AGAM|nr:hypothetical protein PAXRUDRAFT_349510 [Paxillus rubicundulus Ve08.2h10]